MLQAAEAKFSLALQGALEQKGTEREAHADSLTGLLNAHGLFRTLDGELNRSRRSGLRLALIVFDLNGLDSINKTEGYAVGNRLLRRIGEHLQSRCRS